MYFNMILLTYYIFSLCQVAQCISITTINLEFQMVGLVIITIFFNNICKIFFLLHKIFNQLHRMSTLLVEYKTREKQKELKLKILAIFN